MTGERAGSVRLYNDWYEVVIAVVTVGPFAIGVRYSVVGFGNRGALLISTFAWANSANFDGIRIGWLSEKVGIIVPFGEVAMAGRGVGVLTGSDNAWDVEGWFELFSWSLTSWFRAVWIARRTWDEVEEGIGLVGLKYSIFSPIPSLGSDGATVLFGGRADWAEGRSAGKVLTEPVSAIPEDLELWLRLVTLLAREEANIDSFDFLEGGMGAGACLLDFEL
jgi:hypothetical protein